MQSVVFVTDLVVIQRAFVVKATPCTLAWSLLENCAHALEYSLAIKKSCIHP